MKTLTDREIFEKHSQGWKTIPFENLTLEDFDGEFFFIEPNELFKQGLAVDGYSQSAIRTIYNALNENNKRKFRDVVLKDPYKFANFLDHMWEMITYKK